MTKLPRPQRANQYYSKWRKQWVDFVDGFGNTREANASEIKELEKYSYKTRFITQKAEQNEHV